MILSIITINSKNTYNREHPEYDRLWKVRPIITAMSESFLNSYSPHHHLSIDDDTIQRKVFIETVYT